MRAREIDSWADYFQYFAEIYNPFGYLRFAFQEEKDWWEKAEHAAVASATVALPFHALTAMSTGGYWANLPPGISYRAASMKKFSHQLMYNLARSATATASRVPLAVPVAALAVGSAAGWIATADVHGAVAPGVASGIGMPMTPELYSSTASDPTGYRRGLLEWWHSLW